MQGEKILDIPSKTTRGLAEDYEQCKRDTWSSKGMLLRIRSRQSERRDEAPCSQFEQQGAPICIPARCCNGRLRKSYHP